MIKQRKMRTLRNVSRSNKDFAMSECGLISPIDEHQVN